MSNRRELCHAGSSHQLGDSKAIAAPEKAKEVVHSVEPVLSSPIAESVRWLAINPISLINGRSVRGLGGKRREKIERAVTLVML
jgi:hypothetical protein